MDGIGMMMGIGSIAIIQIMQGERQACKGQELKDENR